MNRSHSTLACCVVLSLHLAAACGAGTEGRIVQVELAVEPLPDEGGVLGEFDTATGWHVRLERAELALAALYLFAPEAEPGVMARVSHLVVPVARAHGGHDPLSGKRVRAELLTAQVIDALDPQRRVLEQVDAEAGEVATLALDIATLDSEVAAALDGYQTRVTGEASRDDDVVPFTGGLKVPDEGVTRRVEVALDDVALDDGSTVVIGIRPSVWLREAEFDRLPPPETDGAPRTITADTQVGRAWLIGVRSPAAFSLQSFMKETR